MRTLLKIGGAIVSALVGAISFAFNAFNVNPNAPWSLIGLISFVVFVFFVGWGWYGTEKQFKQLKDAKPKIEMLPEVINNQAKLAIKNTGGDKGEFDAELSFKKINNEVAVWRQLKSFRCRWEDPTKEKTEINADATRTILIATYKNLAHSFSLEFYPLQEDGQPFETATYITECEPLMQIPEIIFTVTVTSSPKAINSPLSKTFRITPLNVFEEIIEPSISHKEGYLN